MKDSSVMGILNGFPLPSRSGVPDLDILYA
jgi:hypothetical protein